jgi:hypothetical protein
MSFARLPRRDTRIVSEYWRPRFASIRLCRPGRPICWSDFRLSASGRLNPHIASNVSFLFPVDLTAARGSPKLCKSPRRGNAGEVSVAQIRNRAIDFRYTVTPRTFANFRAMYDELTVELARSRDQFISDHLNNWFALLDETPAVHEVVSGLERAVFLDALSWIDSIKRPKSGGTAPVFPIDRDKRLGMQLAVFREIANRSLLAGDFAKAFIIHADSDNLGKDAIDQVFLPMARILRHRLETALSENEPPSIPASDRTVSLNHNSAPFKETDDALEALETALVQANDYPDEDDREQRIAEVSAMRRLIKAVRVRLVPVIELARPTLTYLTKQFANASIGKLASMAAGALGKLLGWPI